MLPDYSRVSRLFAVALFFSLFPTFLISASGRMSVYEGHVARVGAEQGETDEDAPNNPIRQGVRIHVLDQETREPVVGAILKHNGKGYLTNTNGACVVAKTKNNKLVLSLRAVGFKEIVSRPYTVKPGEDLIIYLTPNVETLRAVHVEAQRRYTTQLQQSAVIDTKVLEQSPALSLAQLLEKLPGVSSISSGSTIAKPVIQGMHSSRILMINNGVRMESQSWGADHAPEIDHTGASVVEVIKGAEAVRYGYGAVGGVVLLNEAPLS